jgi:hypothetical protein
MGSSRGTSGPQVVTCAELPGQAVESLLDRLGLELVRIGDGKVIPFSYWGDPEAGIAGRRVYARADTPAHSLLHESAHIVCMSAARRAAFTRDARADDDEESAACYLQVVLSDHLPGFGHARCLDDMDAWGYSFREGGARDWFEGDGLASRRWLEGRGLLDAAGAPTWRLRA